MPGAEFGVHIANAMVARGCLVHTGAPAGTRTGISASSIVACTEENETMPATLKTQFRFTLVLSGVSELRTLWSMATGAGSAMMPVSGPVTVSSPWTSIARREDLGTAILGPPSRMSRAGFAVARVDVEPANSLRSRPGPRRIGDRCGEPAGGRPRADRLESIGSRSPRLWVRWFLGFDNQRNRESCLALSSPRRKRWRGR